MKKALFHSVLLLALTALRSIAADSSADPAAGKDPSAVATFSCLSLYWAPPEGAADNSCSVSYREKDGDEWRKALPLWYDARDRQYRGSIVSLKPDTGYEVRLQLDRTATAAALEARTWPENLPIAKVITLPAETLSEPLVISEGGTAGGYVLYRGAPDHRTIIDVADQSPNGVEIKAPYVIVRGLKVAGAQRNGISLGKAAHDVRIEACDISGWGRIASDGWGKNMDAGISAGAPEAHRIVIQGNRIHHPRSNANDWTQSRTITKEKLSNHPNGPQGIVFMNSRGNNVIRFNEVVSDENHRFNDGIGGGENFSTKGFPGPDSDIYGNVVRNTVDDALEIEGGGRNVRIWGNFLDTTFTGVATAVCSVGPLYVFRNVLGRTRTHGDPADAPDNTGTFGKLGDKEDFGGGRRYFLHNTILQPRPDGSTRPLGACWALADWGGFMTETVSRNNIWQTVAGLEQVFLASRGDHTTNSYSIIDHKPSPTNDLDYDLLNNPVLVGSQCYSHAIRGLPVFADPRPEESLLFAQAPSSPAFDAGEILPGFNDNFSGKAPDLGAQEAESPPLRFGIQAYSESIKILLKSLRKKSEEKKK